MNEPFFLVDKPVGFSSFQIVRTFKNRYRKVGHAGTLDPFASGLLIILTDQATKQFDKMQQMEKEYTGEILLGIETETYDITSIETSSGQTYNINTNILELNRIAQEFVGEIEQIPPRYSALKQNGKKLYQLSRQKLMVNVVARTVSVKSFQITGVDPPILQFKTTVGKGVYVRSLVHDFGARMGCGATLISLRRTRIGAYHVVDAQKMGALLSLRQC